MSELEQLRQEAEQLKNQIRVSTPNGSAMSIIINLGCVWIACSESIPFLLEFMSCDYRYVV